MIVLNNFAARLAVLSIMSLTACSGSSSEPSTVSDSGMTPPPQDSATEVCTTLTDVSKGVGRTVNRGVAPAPAGGAIADGTYVLTSYEYYGKSGGTQTTYGTYRFSSGLLEEARKDVPARKMSVATSGTSITYTEVCGADPSTLGAPFTVSYTATPTMLLEITDVSGTTKVKTFTRQ